MGIYSYGHDQFHVSERLTNNSRPLALRISDLAASKTSFDVTPLSLVVARLFPKLWARSASENEKAGRVADHGDVPLAG